MDCRCESLTSSIQKRCLRNPVVIMDVWKGEAAIQEDGKSSVFSLVKHGLRGGMLIGNTIFRSWSSGRFDLKDQMVCDTIRYVT